MKPKIKPTGRNITIHRDRTISFWNLLEQRWCRWDVNYMLTDRHDVLATLTQKDRDAIKRAGS